MVNVGDDEEGTPYIDIGRWIAGTCEGASHDILRASGEEVVFEGEGGSIDKEASA